MKLSAISNAVNERMQPFKALTYLVQRLDSTTISVSGPAFIQLLDQLDSAIDYMDTHVSNVCLSYFPF